MHFGEPSPLQCVYMNDADIGNDNSYGTDKINNDDDDDDDGPVDRRERDANVPKMS